MHTKAPEKRCDNSCNLVCLLYTHKLSSKFCNYCECVFKKNISFCDGITHRDLLWHLATKDFALSILWLFSVTFLASPPGSSKSFILKTHTLSLPSMDIWGMNRKLAVRPSISFYSFWTKIPQNTWENMAEISVLPDKTKRPLTFSILRDS